ncbi:hypothetical protein FCN18_21520 [Prauserella endophytica]|uniref:Uncharacterized protein n=1 Tax=Prauserella endophytica TaxID=1592324 RepID=A0ABY2S179_9PSEU|nr:hypothetical protein FCN18_21520 [Prauserella endophytica]
MSLPPTHLLVAAGILLGWVLLWRIAAWKRRRSLDATRSSDRLLSLFGRVVLTAGLIVGVQWVVIVTAGGNRALVVAVLGIPALFAAYALTKALTVKTVVDTPRVRGGRR